MSLMPTQAAPVTRRDTAGTTADAAQSFSLFVPPFEADGADQSFYGPFPLDPFEDDGADQSLMGPFWLPFEDAGADQSMLGTYVFPFEG